MMKALRITEYGGADVLDVLDVPKPQPGPGHVLVRIEAAAVQIADVALREGHLAEFMPNAELPTTPGWEFAGVVEALGEGASEPATGTRVVGMTRHFETNVGAHAEYVAVPAGNLAVTGDVLSPAELTTLPIALTAVQAYDLLALQSGEALLITGALGAVGGYAIQLAKQRGARVIVSVSSEDEIEARTLGADDVVDRAGDLAAQVRALVPAGADATFNLVNIPEALAATRDGGRMVVTLLPAPEAERDIDVQVVFVQPDGAQLAHLVSAVEAGDLQVRLAGSYPLHRAGDAYERVARGGLRGRLALLP